MPRLIKCNFNNIVIIIQENTGYFYKKLKTNIDKNFLVHTYQKEIQIVFISIIAGQDFKML